MTDENPQQPFDEAEYRRRQRVRANLMGWILGGLAFLFLDVYKRQELIRGSDR